MKKILIIALLVFASCKSEEKQNEASFESIDYSHYILDENIETVKPIKMNSSDSASYMHINQDTLSDEQKVFLNDLLGDSLDISGFSSGVDFNYKKRKTLYYNFHCTASREGANITASQWLDFFKNERGWSRPGYNWIIELDGSLKSLQGSNFDGYTSYNEISYGVKGRNLYSINIAYVGGVDKSLKPKDTMNEAQIKTADALFRIIRLSDPDAVIHGHRDNPQVSKACPSLDVETKFLELIIKKAS